MWILKNSTNLLSSLAYLGLSTTTSIQRFDFPTLYTLIPQNVLKQGSYGSGKTWKTWKKGLFKKNQGKPGKLREFSDHFYNLRENSGNLILPNISDQIGGAIRISEASN